MGTSSQQKVNKATCYAGSRFHRTMTVSILADIIYLYRYTEFAEVILNGLHMYMFADSLRVFEYALMIREH